MTEMSSDLSAVPERARERENAHERRVTELLMANNRLLERARAAEQEAALWRNTAQHMAKVVAAAASVDRVGTLYELLGPPDTKAGRFGLAEPADSLSQQNKELAAEIDALRQRVLRVEEERDRLSSTIERVHSGYNEIGRKLIIATFGRIERWHKEQYDRCLENFKKCIAEPHRYTNGLADQWNERATTYLHLSQKVRLLAADSAEIDGILTSVIAVSVEP